MCERCTEIEAKTARYRWLISAITDEPMIQRLTAFICEMETEKADLHPPPVPAPESKAKE